MHRTNSTYHSIDLADRLIHRANTVDIVDIHWHIAAGSADTNDLVSIRQGADGCLAYGASRADDNDFHTEARV